MPGTRVFLNAIALGILIFIVWDLLTHAWGMIGATLGNVQDGSGGMGPVIGLGALCFAGLGVGLLSLSAYERWLTGDSEKPISLVLVRWLPTSSPSAPVDPGRWGTGSRC
jgi:ZIP family zinc transporter